LGQFIHQAHKRCCKPIANFFRGLTDLFLIAIGKYNNIETYEDIRTPQINQNITDEHFRKKFVAIQFCIDAGTTNCFLGLNI
jgi:hypothetical protein